MPNVIKKKGNHTEERLLEIQAEMRDWSSLAEEVRNLPAPIAFALMAGRHELLSAAKPDCLESVEAREAVINLVRVLLKTNASLQMHSQLMSQLTEDFLGHFKGITTAAQRIRTFGEFRNPGEDDGDE